MMKGEKKKEIYRHRMEEKERGRFAKEGSSSGKLRARNYLGDKRQSEGKRNDLCTPMGIQRVLSVVHFQ